MSFCSWFLLPIMHVFTHSYCQSSNTTITFVMKITLPTTPQHKIQDSNSNHYYIIISNNKKFNNLKIIGLWPDLQIILGVLASCFITVCPKMLKFDQNWSKIDQNCSKNVQMWVSSRFAAWLEFMHNTVWSFATM